MTIQDWGVTYDDLEPYYDQFEYLCGISGQAGNVQGKIQPGGNPFEGPRARAYPLPPLKRSYATVLFDKAAKDVGLKPFPCAAANTSQPYKNPYGVQMGQCTYCGYCEWFACGNYSKSSPQTTILPALLPKDNFSYRTLCDVTRVNLDSTGKRASLGVIMIFLIWIAGNIPNHVDVEWFKRGGGIVGHDHPPAYRFNAGQKTIYWIVVLGGTAVAVSGYVLMFPFYGTDIHTMQSAEIAHGIVAMLFVAAMLGHIYIGTIGMEGAFEAMGTGTVDLNWAKEHHRLWLDEEMARTGPNESQRQPALRPAE